MKRISSIDIARGLAMLIMPLDHVREYLHLWSRTHSPIDLAVTTPAIFFTRWITHFCAPAFVFLSGVSAALALKRDPEHGRGWLFSRGIFLIVLEFTVVNFALTLDVRFRLLVFEVIAAIGSGLVILSFLSRLPWKILVVLALLIFLGHDLLSPAQAMSPGAPALTAGRVLKAVLISPDGIQVSPRLLFVIAYPVLPWLGIMLMGFVAARWFDQPAERRRVLFLRAGVVALSLFIVLRLVNQYGDPDPWSAQKNGLYTVLSFLDLTKYPPSLLFGLAMLGAVCLVLAAAEGKDNVVTRVLQVYGRTPLFYFVVHLYLIHLTMLVTMFLQGYGLSELDFGPFQFGRPAVGGGVSLVAVYIIWVVVLIVMYPVCRWYGKYKMEHREKKWLRYV